MIKPVATLFFGAIISLTVLARDDAESVVLLHCELERAKILLKLDRSDGFYESPNSRFYVVPSFVLYGDLERGLNGGNLSPDEKEDLVLGRAVYINQQFEDARANEVLIARDFVELEGGFVQFVSHFGFQQSELIIDRASLEVSHPNSTNILGECTVIDKESYTALYIRYEAKVAELYEGWLNSSTAPRKNKNKI